MYENIKLESDKNKATIKSRAQLIKYVYGLKKKTAKTTTVSVYSKCFYNSQEIRAEFEMILNMSSDFLAHTLKLDNLSQSDINKILISKIESKYDSKIKCDDLSSSQVEVVLKEIEKSLSFCKRHNYLVKTKFLISNHNQAEAFSFGNQEIELKMDSKAHIIVHEIMHNFLFINRLDETCLAEDLNGKLNSKALNKMISSLSGNTPFSTEMRKFMELQMPVQNMKAIVKKFVPHYDDNNSETVANIASLLYAFEAKEEMPSDIFYLRDDLSLQIEAVKRKIKNNAEMPEWAFEFSAWTKEEFNKVQIDRLKDLESRPSRVEVDLISFVKFVAPVFQQFIQTVPENIKDLKKHYKKVN